MSTRTYMNTLESFCFMLGFAIALAAQIQIAHLYGANRTKEAYTAAYRALKIGLVVVVINAFLLFLFGVHLLHLFTSDPAIIKLGTSLLGFNLLLQPGKVFNMVFGNSLNALGDTRFIMVTSLISMWFVATAMSYWVGVHLGMGLIGIYICMICDEYIRGCLAFFRWRGRKYLLRAEQLENQKNSQTQVTMTRATLN